jgi:hypothetical protein
MKESSLLVFYLSKYFQQKVAVHEKIMNTSTVPLLM